METILTLFNGLHGTTQTLKVSLVDKDNNSYEIAKVFDLAALTSDDVADLFESLAEEIRDRENQDSEEDEYQPQFFA